MKQGLTSRSNWVKLTLRVGLVAGIGSLVLSGCGSSDDDTSSDPTTTSSTGTSTKEPIKIMVLGSLQSQSLSVPGIQYGVEAGIAAINAAGGLDGHQVEVEACNDQVDINQASACARQAVSDKVVAVVGALTIYGDAVVPILAAGGIPDIGPFPISNLESDNADSWPIQGGNLMESRGIAELMKDNGVTTVNQVQVDTVAGKHSGAGVKLALENRGITVKNTQYVPATTSDMAAAVKAATSDDVGGITTNLAPAQVVPFLTAAKQQGITQQLAFTSTILSPATLEQAGANAEGAFAAGSFPSLDNTSIKAIADYHADMEKYQAGKDFDAYSLNGWAATQFLKLAVTHLEGDLTSANLITALNAIDGDEFLWIPDFSTQPNPTEGSSRIFNTTIFLNQVVDGKLKQIGDPVKLTE